MTRKTIKLTGLALAIAVGLEEITKRRADEQSAFHEKVDRDCSALTTLANNEVNTALSRLAEELGIEDFRNGDHSLDLRYLAEHGLAFVVSEVDDEAPALATDQ